jgi:hypothetical protein
MIVGMTNMQIPILALGGKQNAIYLEQNHDKLSSIICFQNEIDFSLS